MVGHGIVSFAGFLTICRVLVSRPHLNPHVRLFLLQVPHSLQWPTSHPSNKEKKIQIQITVLYQFVPLSSNL